MGYLYRPKLKCGARGVALVSLAFLWLAGCATMTLDAKTGESSVVRGTLNIVLGNRQGIVAMTDSMVTQISFSAGGAVQIRQLPDPGKKLFRLDDYSVCTIAGFGSKSLSSAPEFGANAAGIIERYAEELGRNTSHRASFREKLTALSFLFEFYLTSVSNVELITQGQTQPDKYAFELLLAGYDDDLKAKIGRLSIMAAVIPMADGRPGIRAETLRVAVRPVEDSLIYELAGQPDIADAILQRRQATSDPAVQTYTASITADHGRSLTLEQLAALADALVRHTERVNSTVGGERQLALLRGGRVETIRGPHFSASAARPMKFILLLGNRFADVGTAVKIEGGTVLFVRNVFQRAAQSIDGSYFFGNQFADCEIRYNGGKTRFDTTNQVTNCTLLLGPQAPAGSPVVQQLLQNFQWRAVRHEAASKRSR
ncbi:MAG: hypothetical protein HYU25_17945 [Candidatus Rokubacteria bacterium]|nr:hypothetical protein [Candidatus Rokubacteria bacterium]